VKKDRYTIVAKGPEASITGLDHLDLRVVAFGDCVNDLMIYVGKYSGVMFIQHCSNFDHR
jgi:hypothetical protein